ncbi:DHH family phosphoesterase [Nanoarchaeota archaeon]
MKEADFKRILEELDNCKRPLYFFHDDADGLCSFLQFYRYKREGKGVCVKSQPKVDERFFKVVKEYGPDKIFILDLAIIDEEFVDEFRKIPIVMVDHHGVLKVDRVKYFNPRKDNPKDNTCVSELCYHVIPGDDDLWIAAAGIVGDWQLSDVTKKFSSKHPELLPAEVDRPEKALFGTPFSRLIKVLNFMLKGPTQEVMKCVKIMTRVQGPYELLNSETSQTKFIMKRFERINRLYAELMDYAVKKVGTSKLLLVRYQENKMSFSGELANELLFKYPDKVVLVGREKSGEMKCSLRSGPNINVRQALERALSGINGRGGGHEQACGAVIPVEQFSTFIEQLKEQI